MFGIHLVKWQINWLCKQDRAQLLFDKYLYVGSFRNGAEVLKSDSMTLMILTYEVSFYSFPTFNDTCSSKAFFISLVRKKKCFLKSFSPAEATMTNKNVWGD